MECCLVVFLAVRSDRSRSGNDFAVLFDCKRLSGTQRTAFPCQGMDICIRQLALFPIHRDFKVSSCFQAGNRTFRPYVGQGRQQVDVAGMALQQYFRDAGRIAEVPVDLERRMRTKHISEQTAAFVFAVAESDRVEQVGDDFIGVVTV